MKTICAITSSRADYGLLYYTLKKLDSSKKINLKIIASGMHLSKQHGFTYKEILKDNFIIHQKVYFPSQSKNNKELSKSFTIAVKRYSASIDKIKPDSIILLGDRYEIFAAAIAAFLLQIPIFHCHGGEASYGSQDEYFRNCITKLSNIHFVATERYRKRVIQLGENPNNVYNVGGLGVENINKLKLLNKKKLQKILNVDFNNNTFLITFHPTTLEASNSLKHLNQIFEALEYFKDNNVIFTSSNSDVLGGLINKKIKNYVAKYKNFFFFYSLGQLVYLSTLKHSDLVIGNSSSGIIEAPSFKKPTVNIGKRQLGRERAISVLDCNPKKQEIITSIQKALSKSFLKKIKDCKNPYENGNSSKKILKTIEKFKLDSINNNFFDVKFKI